MAMKLILNGLQMQMVSTVHQILEMPLGTNRQWETGGKEYGFLVLSRNMPG